MKARAILLEGRVTSRLEKLKFLDSLKTDYSLLFSFVAKKTRGQLFACDCTPHTQFRNICLMFDVDGCAKANIQ